RAVGEAALAADRAADAGDFLAECLAALGELVERAMEVGGDALAGNREADAKVAVAGGLQCREELLEVLLRDLRRAVLRRLRAVLRLRAGALARPCRLAPLRFVSDRHLVPPISLNWVTFSSALGL